MCWDDRAGDGDVSRQRDFMMRTLAAETTRKDA